MILILSIILIRLFLTLTGLLISLISLLILSLKRKFPDLKNPRTLTKQFLMLTSGLMSLLFLKMRNLFSLILRTSVETHLRTEDLFSLLSADSHLPSLFRELVLFAVLLMNIFMTTIIRVS